jgi:putative addiction module component (TIGR02574 family)
VSSVLDKIEKQTRALKPREKAALARRLIDQLDPTVDANVERLWIEEAERRLRAYRAGELKSLPGDEVMARARKRLG